MPVTLPPGRLRLATRPRSRVTPLEKTIGIVVVADLAASVAVLPPASRRSRATCRPTKSAASAGSRSFGRPPSDIRSLHSGLRQSRFRSGPGGTQRRGARRFRRLAARNPTTGIAGCCARAAAAKRPRRRAQQSMSRLPMVSAMCPPSREVFMGGTIARPSSTLVAVLQAWRRRCLLWVIRVDIAMFALPSAIHNTEIIHVRSRPFCCPFSASLLQTTGQPPQLLRPGFARSGDT